MTRNALSLLLVLSFSVSGCATPRQARIGGFVTGAVLAAGGVAMLADMDPGGEGPGESHEGTLACIAGGCAIAGGLILTGVGVALLTALLTADIPPSAPLHEAEPAPLSLSLIPVGPLPADTSDPQTIQLARQARTAASRGDCSVAIVMRDQIYDRDPAYAESLARNATLGDCR